MKKCFICNIEKPITEFYKHPTTSDGHLGKCKECTKKYVKSWKKEAYKNPEYVEKENAKARERGKVRWKDGRIKPPPTKIKTATIYRYFDKYPEKVKGAIAVRKLTRLPSESLHHWSYNDEHLKDIIRLSKADHYKAHRFIIYDQERMMYRRSDTNELLDTKENHEQYIFYCIKNKI